MSGVALLLRSLWWRRGLAAATLLISVLTITAAALGPLYARAASESVLQDRLREAHAAAGLHFSAQRPADLPGSTPAPGSVLGYDSVIRELFTPLWFSANAASGAPTVTRMIWREGACGHLVLVSGRCPSGPGEALVSDRTVQAGVYGWRLGRTLALGGGAATVRIVGTYRPTSVTDPFWFGRGPTYFDAHGAGSSESGDTVDAIFVTPGELTGWDQPVEADADYPLTPAALRLDDVPAERDAVRRLLGTHGTTAPVVLSTGLLRALDRAADDRRLLERDTLVVSLQLALLAWVVLFQVVSGAAEARSNEVAIAKLRGHRPASTVAFGLGEPMTLLVLAVPLGIAAAYGITRALADSALVAGVPVVVSAAPVLSAVAAFAGGLVAALAASWRTLTRPVLEQWRHTPHRLRYGRVLWVLEVVLALAAVAGVVLLRRRGGGTAPLLAPGLLVFAVAILGVGGLPALCRGLARRTRASRWVGAFLATRQVGRRPVGLRVAVLLAVAIGLAVFAVAGESAASANRVSRADAELGAYRVASVALDPGTDPMVAVRRADPDGRWAMAAATWLPDGGQSVAGTLLAVDPSRLAAVAEPVQGGWSATDLASALVAGSAPPITIRATMVRVALTVHELRGAPILEIDLRGSQPRMTAEGPTLRAGRHEYEVAVPCRAGCQLSGLTWRRPVDTTGTMSGRVTLTGIDQRSARGWKPLDLSFATPGSWHRSPPQGYATDTVSLRPDGVTDRFTSRLGEFGGILYGDPASIPAVAAPSGLVPADAAPSPLALVDAVGARAEFHVVGSASVLPVVLDRGVVMSLRDVFDELPSLGTDARWQVWLSSAAPPDALRRLDAAGLHVQSVATRSARVRVLARQAPALAFLLLLVGAVAAAVLAVGGTALSVSASSRQRSYEIAALRAVRVRDRSLLSAAVVEQLLYLGTALVLGVPAGLLAARLALPVIPEFSDATPVALRYVPQWPATIGFVAGLSVLLVLTGVVAGWAVLRLAVSARLREAE